MAQIKEKIRLGQNLTGNRSVPISTAENLKQKKTGSFQTLKIFLFFFFNIFFGNAKYLWKFVNLI